MNCHMIKAVIDTNVFVSALWTKNPNSPTRRILIALLHGRFIPLHNAEILAEYSEVLCRREFKFDAEQVSKLIEGIRNEGLNASRAKASETFPDPDDCVFYEVALSEPDAHLVTGNLKHYPTSPIVVTPAQFCELLGI